MLRAIYQFILFSILLSISFNPHSLLAQIAPGVQQSAAQTATVTGTVVRNDGTPVAGAGIHLTGPSARLVTIGDAHGAFAFTSVPYGTYRIDVASASGTVSRVGIMVRGDINVAIQYKPATSQLKEIANVSTRSAGAQINVSPASIASVSPSDYAFAGNASWQHLLNSVPGVVVGGNLEGGASCAAALPGNPIQPAILSIDGALPYETSVTLDGMPLQNSSPGDNLFFGAAPGGGADVSFLPLAAFENADIVRGPGANAPSIVDSIGGSFVLHAPGRIDRNEFDFSTSTDPYGGIVANLKGAMRFGKLSALVVYGINDSPGPVNGNFITGLDYGILSVNGNAVTNTGELGVTGTAKFPNSNYLAQDNLLFCCQPYSTGWTQHNGALALSYDFSSSVNAQVFYAGSSSVMEYPEPEFQVNFAPAAGYAGALPAGGYVFPDLAEVGPIEKAESLLEEKVTAYIGHGVLRLAALQNNSFYNIGFANYVAPNGSYTVYGTAYYATAPTTPVNFNGTPAQLTFLPLSVAVQYWTNNRDLLGSYAVQLGNSSDADISFVTSYYDAPGYADEVYFGTLLNDVFSTNSVSERTDELRLHAGTQISDRLSLDASWYIAKGTYHLPNPADPTHNTYADSVFSYSAPHVSAVWRPATDVSVRAAVGGGYALPPITDLTGANTTVNCTSGTLCTQTLTNLNLQPEKSFGFDLGTDIRLHRDTVVSLDLYRTNLFGQFFESSTLVTSSCPASVCSIAGLPLYTTQYENLAESRFEGINLDLRHEPIRGIYWHAAVGLTRGYVVSVPAGFYNTASCTNCTNTYIVPGINFDGANQSTVPYANGSAEIGYRWSPDKYIALDSTYFGNNNPYFQPAFVELDGQIGYPLTRNISLIGTFRNITGIYDQPYQVSSPTFEVPLEGSASPSTAPYPEALLGIPYGPRTFILTLNVKSL